jgi:hypothetical protein
MKLLEQIKAWWYGPRSQQPKLYLNAPSWEFGSVWNQSLLDRPERPPRVRENIWASEIGGAMIDRYLKMNGVAQSNPPNARSLRKFQAADIWEFIVSFVLKRAGLLIETQEKVRYRYPGLLEVVGKLDQFAGGKPDWDKARREVKLVGFPPIIESASLAIVDQLSARFGNAPLRTVVLEVKSLGSFVFERYEVTQKADPRHIGQQFHYLKAKSLPEGHIVYVCRDDCRIVEIPIFNPSDAEKAYKGDIERISSFLQNKERPAKEQEILFDEVTFKFRTNWHVEYSGYLTLLYGYKEPIHYREAWDKSVSSFNRTFKRCVIGAKMTDLNLKTIENAQKIFPQWNDLVDRAKAAAKTDPKLIQEEEAEAA